MLARYFVLINSLQKSQVWEATRIILRVFTNNQAVINFFELKAYGFLKDTHSIIQTSEYIKLPNKIS
jgi:hypothetical protein